MSGHIVVVLAGAPRGRWREAFEDVVEVGDPISAVAKATARTVFWVSASDLTSVKSLRRARPDLPLVALSLKPDALESMRLFEAGASGYCHALAVPDLLRQVDIVVRNGGLWVGPDLMSRAVAAAARLEVRAGADARMLDGLSPRERDVAEQVVSGASNKEIAQKLGITLRTVKAHMGAIFEKLAVRDRLQLVLILRKAAAARTP
ncbi:MAG: response regulator transcription factor [Sinimarinibacterium sp.]|jgi:DNA-binding NarL/FixJ family response regulator